MPLYEYECEHCEIDFEQRVSVDQRNSVDCPHCGNPAIKKISASNHTFGWTRSTILDPFARKDELVRDI